MRTWPARFLAASLLSALIAGLAGSSVAAESERILTFDSRIRIDTMGLLTVTETISVVAAGQRIKRGIFRDFPTTYRDRLGGTVRVNFDVSRVLRDGRPEPWTVRDRANGKRLYIGDPDVLLPPGTHTYAIAYTSDRQLGFFEGHDELYWNVTGNDWAFPIASARAVVELPAGAVALDTAAYTGPVGSKGGDYSVQHGADGRLVFSTTGPLAAGEGLTIAVSWPKGFVVAPTVRDEARYLLLDNPAAVAAVVGVFILLIYYLFAWRAIGRDPPRGTIIPLFAPPEGFSPAAVRFVMRMGYSNKVFAAAAVNMAVKGYVVIEEDESGEFALRRTDDDGASLSSGERKIARALFGGVEARQGQRVAVPLASENHKKIAKAVAALKKSLKTEFEKIHFRKNALYVIPGACISVLALVAVILASRDPEMAGGLGAWLVGWTAGCFFLVLRARNAWRSGSTAAAVGATLFAVPFLGAEVVVLAQLALLASLPAAILLAVTVLINAVFYHLLRAPTVAGRRVMDRIEGFKMYLEVAEKDRLAVLNPPERTPQLFEKYLPYALALDVEHEWSEQFADVLATAGHADTAGYSPSWYAGSGWRAGGADGLASSLGGSLAGAISSSAQAPGSSSAFGGGGGGGFSGGGGGGGGGGGW